MGPPGPIIQISCQIEIGDLRGTWSDIENNQVFDLKIRRDGVLSDTWFGTRDNQVFDLKIRRDGALRGIWSGTEHNQIFDLKIKRVGALKGTWSNTKDHQVFDLKIRRKEISNPFIRRTMRCYLEGGSGQMKKHAGFMLSQFF